jgi:hypothetical protein
MMPALSRGLMSLAFVVFVTACGALPRGPETRPQADKLFLQAMDEISAAAPGTAFETLRRDYPDSPWTVQAQAIAELTRTCDAQEDRVQALKQDKSRLLQENRKLKEDLEKLKALVIDTEKRRR